MTACIGVDPGFRWSAGVLRVGDAALNGFTSGPVAADGSPARLANDKISPAALDRYCAQIGKNLDSLYDLSIELGHGPPLVAVEMPYPSDRIPLRCWLVTWTVAWNVMGRYDDVIPITPAGHGKRHKAPGATERLADYYPDSLIRSRPFGWMRCAAPRTARDHERAGFDVAGVALASQLALTGTEG